MWVKPLMTGQHAKLSKTVKNYLRYFAKIVNFLFNYIYTTKKQNKTYYLFTFKVKGVPVNAHTELT